jgi:hypothetical protein
MLAAPVPAPPGPLLSAVLDASSGGQLKDDRLSLVVPAGAVGPAGGELNVLAIDTAAAPALPSGFSIPSSAFVITLTDTATGTQTGQPSMPLTLRYELTSAELGAASGDATRLKLATWLNDAWVPLGCSVQGTTLECALPHLSLFAVVAAPPPALQMDAPLDNGWFAQQANGFNGAGDLGFAVVDDADASLWSEYQRLGGIDRLGYPISRRYEDNGHITQAFQRAILQWQPDSGTATTLHVFDELNARGLDPWLDAARQVPPASGAPDPSVLSSAPALSEAYAADPEAAVLYGTPLAVKDYGTFVAARFEGAVLQLWSAEGGSTAGAKLTVGNTGDVAKDSGLIPTSALAPQHAPAPRATDPTGANLTTTADPTIADPANLASTAAPEQSDDSQAEPGIGAGEDAGSGA